MWNGFTLDPSHECGDKGLRSSFITFSISNSKFTSEKNQAKEVLMAYFMKLAVVVSLAWLLLAQTGRVFIRHPYCLISAWSLSIQTATITKANHGIKGMLILKLPRSFSWRLSGASSLRFWWNLRQREMHLDSRWSLGKVQRRQMHPISSGQVFHVDVHHSHETQRPQRLMRHDLVVSDEL